MSAIPNYLIPLFLYQAFYAKDVPGDLAGCEKCNDAVRLDKHGGPLRDKNEQLVVPEVLCLAQFFLMKLRATLCNESEGNVKEMQTYW